MRNAGGGRAATFTWMFAALKHDLSRRSFDRETTRIPLDGATQTTWFGTAAACPVRGRKGRIVTGAGELFRFALAMWPNSGLARWCVQRGRGPLLMGWRF